MQKQSSGYSLLQTHMPVRVHFVGPVECQARADLSFPFEVKDSVENLMKGMDLSPGKDTKAHMQTCLPTVHGGSNSEAH